MYVKESLKTYIDDTAGRKPVPGGGSTAAAAGALGAALSSMLARFTADNKRYGNVRPKIKILLKKNEAIRRNLMRLIDKDVLVYGRLNAAFSAKRGCSPETKQRLLKDAAEVPFLICGLCYEAMDICTYLAENANTNLITDAGCAGLLLEAAFSAALLNVKINLKYIKDSRFIAQKNGVLNKMAKNICRKRKQVMDRVGKFV
ncbi:MAG: cyclodeaminase/cyclohydrolase family protein [Candidatus Omnitrophica bacterium]|nr:cyclodeaminase/cyclohydrolase family protein [Candidatus Omnitrophota bacterium]MBU4478924.1 cyclodeaminase/cyclohydrolase family protein [Candidatus Omnitrophota bacterium]MCG2704383.1 cyclodeaminase/cyclohydrolase family protein [Candidatus Omnitrophota bacterium]